MRVLQINAVYERLSTGRNVMELHMSLLGDGHESFVAAPELYGLSERCYKIGCLPDRKLHALLSRVSGLQGYFSRLATRGLLGYIHKIRPDIVHLGNLHGNYINVPMLLKHLAKNDIATVVTLHDSWFYTGKCVYYIEDKCDKWMDKCGGCPALKKGNISLFFDRSTKMLADKKRLFGAIDRLGVIGVSDWITEDAEKSILKDADMIGRIYNWVDTELFCPRDTAKLRDELGLAGKTVILGVAAEWNPLKGIDVFNALADMLPDNYRILLIGVKPKREHERIVYLGAVDEAVSMAQLYALADVFVNPSVQEAFGKTTAEALSCGTPVIALRNTASPEIVGEDESCGLLVDETTGEAYYKCIERFARLGKAHFTHNCRARAQALFDKEKNIGEHIKMYSSLIGKN